jgi:hypothetical protein
MCQINEGNNFPSRERTVIRDLLSIERRYSRNRENNGSAVKDQPL